jgi:predicted RND superfamily exporter protein
MRPIFMSTFTTIFGMLPLVLMPGEGSVIYRGLATTIVGGMACSMLFTLLLLPSLLRIGTAAHVGHLAGETAGQMTGQMTGKTAAAASRRPALESAA